jgi:hypothetical protein
MVLSITTKTTLSICFPKREMLLQSTLKLLPIVAKFFTRIPHAYAGQCRSKEAMLPVFMSVVGNSSTTTQPVLAFA